MSVLIVFLLLQASPIRVVLSAAVMTGTFVVVDLLIPNQKRIRDEHTPALYATAVVYSLFVALIVIVIVPSETKQTSSLSDFFEGATNAIANVITIALINLFAASILTFFSTRRAMSANYGGRSTLILWMNIPGYFATIYFVIFVCSLVIQ